MLKKTRDRIFVVIRAALLLSVALNAVLICLELLRGAAEDRSLQIEFIAANVESALWALITFALSFGSTIIEKHQKIDIPDILEVIIVIFIYAGLFLSVRFKLYYKFFWWDDFLHTLSGIIMGFIGFIVIYKINYRYTMNISPLLVALFSFTFAITLGVFWEIMEFTCDVLLGTANQKWNLSDTEILMGKPYQGSGLRDTMSDLILDSIGAFATSLITYYMYKNQKKKVLKKMKGMIKSRASY
ncbi:MAG: hypothetical protein LBH51_05285 [Treponema sp.]|jgi:hypothetical protein|nr:hypothetical protein [Treponema sp.]